MRVAPLAVAGRVLARSHLEPDCDRQHFSLLVIDAFQPCLIAHEVRRHAAEYRMWLAPICLGHLLSRSDEEGLPKLVFGPCPCLVHRPVLGFVNG